MSLWSLLAALTLPLIIGAIWLYAAHHLGSTEHRHRSRSTPFHNRRICLLIAHPDDEAMFFAPTLLALTQPEHDNHVEILCLSSGNADGLGHIRKQELVQSAQMLGVKQAKDIVVLDDERFPDSMKIEWSAKRIADLLDSRYRPRQDIAAHETGDSLGADKPRGIDVLITFDRNGVSHHPNHVSLYKGARLWQSASNEAYTNAKTQQEHSLSIYTLTTTSWLRKYLSILDIPITRIFSTIYSQRLSGKQEEEQEQDMPYSVIHGNDFKAYKQAQKAMTQGHKSQMRWFRWGWISISRYMIVNDLRRLTTGVAESQSPRAS